MTLDLTDDETRALVRLLRRAIDEARYPLSPRLDPLKTILAKLDPPAPQPEPLPPLKPDREVASRSIDARSASVGMRPTHGQGRQRRRGN